MSSALKVAVVKFPGSNCDLDALRAIAKVPGLRPYLVWHEDSAVASYDAVVLPGGFSFGDYLRAGAIAARSPAMGRVAKMADRGRPVLGICNGFQVLTEAGLLPGALLRNSSLRFVCKWVNVRVERTDTCFTRGTARGRVLRMPIAHNEGRFVGPKHDLRKLEAEGRVVFRYCDPEGNLSRQSNPTGTSGGIAGISNREGNVVGLMPHPERAADGVLSPYGTEDGRLLFESLLGTVN